jgi:hypothetical protein
MGQHLKLFTGTDLLAQLNGLSQRGRRSRPNGAEIHEASGGMKTFSGRHRVAKLAVHIFTGNIAALHAPNIIGVKGMDADYFASCRD